MIASFLNRREGITVISRSKLAFPCVPGCDALKCMGLKGCCCQCVVVTHSDGQPFYVVPLCAYLRGNGLCWNKWGQVLFCDTVLKTLRLGTKQSAL